MGDEDRADVGKHGAEIFAARVVVVLAVEPGQDGHDRLDRGVDLRQICLLEEAGLVDDLVHDFAHGVDHQIDGAIVADAGIHLTVVHRDVGTVPDKDSECAQAVTAGTPCLLEVSLRAFGDTQMHDEPDVRLVYAHAERIGTHHDAYVSPFP